MIRIIFDTMDQFTEFSASVAYKDAPCANCSRVKAAYASGDIEQLAYEITTNYSFKTKTSECCCGASADECRECVKKHIEDCKSCVWFYIGSYTIIEDDYTEDI